MPPALLAPGFGAPNPPPPSTSVGAVGSGDTEVDRVALADEFPEAVADEFLEGEGPPMVTMMPWVTVVPTVRGGKVVVKMVNEVETWTDDGDGDGCRCRCERCRRRGVRWTDLCCREP